MMADDEAPATVATNLSLKAPGLFNFRRPDEWPKWKRRFNQYLATTGLDRADDTRTVSMMLYCMGEDAEDVLTSTNITDDEREVFATVIAKLDGFFQVTRNIIFERAKFNRIDQGEGESAEQYITCLYSLVENCDYGALKDDLLRDRIVVGIKDKTLSEKLTQHSRWKKLRRKSDRKKLYRNKARVLTGHYLVNQK